MNKSVSTLIRLISMALLIVMSLSIISCQYLPFLEDLGNQGNTGDGENNDHTHSFVGGKCDCGETDPDYKPHEHSFVGGKCDCGETDPDYKPEIVTITIAEALEICAQYPDGSPEEYYIRATVKTVSNASYGEMYIEDETGEIYVYGTRGADGTTFFDKLSERPVKGDEVLLLCQLSQYKGTSQVKLAKLIEFKHVDRKSVV